MKKSVIFVVFVIIFSSLSFAKVVDVPSVGEGEEIPLPLVQENIKRYIYSGSNILASIENNEIKYYHQDRLGSNRVVTDSSGNKVGEFLSLPYGQKIVQTGVDYPFTGKEEDESGLYYFSARYYDSDLGKFTSVDPVQENEAYSYVANNPMMFVDPSGMSGFPVSFSDMDPDKKKEVVYGREKPQYQEAHIFVGDPASDTSISVIRPIKEWAWNKLSLPGNLLGIANLVAQEYEELGISKDQIHIHYVLPRSVFYASSLGGENLLEPKEFMAKIRETYENPNSLIALIGHSSSEVDKEGLLRMSFLATNDRGRGHNAYDMEFIFGSNSLNSEPPFSAIKFKGDADWTIKNQDTYGRCEFYGCALNLGGAAKFESSGLREQMGRRSDYSNYYSFLRDIQGNF